jgi:hypothetical protein
MTSKQDSGMFEKEQNDILEQRKEIEECMRNVKRDLKVLKDIVSDGLETDGLEEELVETVIEALEEVAAPVVTEENVVEEVEPKEASPEPSLTPEDLGLVTSEPDTTEDAKFSPEDLGLSTEKEESVGDQKSNQS